MAQKTNELVIGTVGAQVTTGGASAVVAIPNNASGVIAKYVRLQATGNCYIKPGLVGSTCTVNDCLLSPNEALVLNVFGFTHIAYLQETAAAKLNITPLEIG
jgi:hypothetical protein